MEEPQVRRQWHEDPQDYIRKRVELTPSGCWEWQLSINENGYGRCFRRDTRGYAHRFSYASFVGDLAEGMQIDHICRNRRCVNPDHLEQVTASENQRRGNTANYGRNYSLFLAGTGLWSAAVEIKEEKSKSTRRRKIIRSKSREVAAERMEIWMAQNADKLVGIK